MNLADRIREARLSSGQTQENLAREAEISTGTLRMIESGATPSPTLSTLVAIARALDMTVIELLEGVEDDR